MARKSTASGKESEKARSRGRPATHATPVLVRLYPSQLAALDDWIAQQPDPKPTRPKALVTRAKLGN